jgi:pimeloyl-ACP methyl ester carboxylesterase
LIDESVNRDILTMPMELFCVSKGSGPPLVLLHGTGGSWEAWGSVIGLLAPHRRVFAVDLPGFGASPSLPDETPPTIGMLADAVAGWMATSGLERPHVAGNSLGGAVALELAKGDQVASATALSPIGFSNRWEFAYGAASLRATRAGARLTGPIAPLLFGNRLGRTALLWQAMARPWRMSGEAAIRGSRAMAAAPAFKATVRAAGEYRFVGPSGDVPVTIGWGTRDRLLFWRQAKWAQETLSEASFVPLPGCGHVPMTDDPELIAAVLLEGSETAKGALEHGGAPAD